MRWAFGWVVAAFFCCAAGESISEAKPDEPLREAQASFDEARRLKDAGLYVEALARAGHALQLREAVLGSTHPEVARCLDLVGEIYLYQGNMDNAGSLLRRALAIREAALGMNHPDVAESLNNLAVVYCSQGLYGQSEALYQRSLTIRETVLGKGHPDVAASLSNLAALYYEQGLYSRAEPLMRRSLLLWEASLGREDPLVATALNNLAYLYQVQGLHRRAEPLARRALALWEASLGKKHPNVATSLDNLASIYADQGLYWKAEPLYQRALSIRETALGKDHPHVADSLNNFANFYWARGLYGKAELLHLRALATREAVFGSAHPLVAQSLNDLGRLRLAQNRLDGALPFFTRSFFITEQRLRHEALDFSESRFASFLDHLRAYEETLYGLLRAHPEDARVRRLALSAVLMLKGRSVSETANIFRTLYRSLGDEDRGTLEQLRSLRTRLVSLSLSGPGALPADVYQQSLKSLAEQGDALEADLAKRSAPLRSLTALPTPAEIVDRVAASLPKDSALVEFIAYKDSPLVPKAGVPPGKRVSQVRYLALVLFPDASTRAVDLGPSIPIDSAAAHLVDVLAEREASFEAAAQQLYHRVFQPLLPLLGSTRRLFLSADGQLSLIPFSALHDGQGFLLDTFDITYLTSGRELLPRIQDRAPASSVSVLADPNFTALPASAPSSPPPAQTRSLPAGFLRRFLSNPDAEVDRSAWVPLPGTRREAQAIQRLLPQAQVFLGAEATKERLLRLPAPGILHLATHGFFLGQAAAPSGSRGLAMVDSLSGAPPPQQEPLLNSGLVLAGAQATASEASPVRPGSSLVTALELAGLDLWSTQLVVLSACDTGQGAVRLGQGVYGLRRALVAAGAETVLVSLWKVNDDSTHLLMESYYRNLLSGQGRASALREAMRTLRVTHPHPHAWAPFIALGSNAPLKGIAPVSAPPSP
jgi:CHAT domain-containing protein/Tfp pilus assembly protein PilF